MKLPKGRRRIAPALPCSDEDWADYKRPSFNGLSGHDALSSPNCAKGRLQRLALAKLQEKHGRGEIPTSIRFLFYEFEQEGILSKRVLRRDGKEGKRKPTQDLTDAITLLREASLIPWDWIVDESRNVSQWRYADSVKDYLTESVDLASIDRFPGVLRPIIICESRGIGGVLERGIARDYRVTVASTGGQVNGYLHTKVATYLNDDDTCILYVGDYDLAGHDIEENTKQVLESATGRTFDEDTWERVMITEQQCRDLRRRGIEPVLKKDRRFKDGRPHEAYEAEALGQSTVMQVIEKRLEELAPEPLADVLEREEEQREAMRRMLQRRR